MESRHCGQGQKKILLELGVKCVTEPTNHVKLSVKATARSNWYQGPVKPKTNLCLPQFVLAEERRSSSLPRVYNFVCRYSWLVVREWSLLMPGEGAGRYFEGAPWKFNRDHKKEIKFQYLVPEKNEMMEQRLNIAVMECYYLSKPVDESGRPVRGYTQRMHALWKERGLPKITEQRLCDQATAIRKNEWFTSVELDEIRRRMTAVDEELEEQGYRMYRHRTWTGWWTKWKCQCADYRQWYDEWWG